MAANVIVLVFIFRSNVALEKATEMKLNLKAVTVKKIKFSYSRMFFSLQNCGRTIYLRKYIWREHKKSPPELKEIEKKTVGQLKEYTAKLSNIFSYSNRNSFWTTWTKSKREDINTILSKKIDKEERDRDILRVTCIPVYQNTHISYNNQALAYQVQWPMWISLHHWVLLKNLLFYLSNIVKKSSFNCSCNDS